MHADDWLKCYGDGWGKRLCPASYSHPAKASYALTVRIYEHAIEEGWIEPGQTVLDPFAGIGGFALEAMRHGLHFIGCELEMRFCDMGQGCDCTGISKEDWIRFQGRWDRACYQDGRHWCPQCLAEAKEIEHDRGQLRMFARAPSASYVRNSGKIPCTPVHRYHGNIETWEAQGMPGTAIIVQGDSRRLGEVLAEAQLCLSSPPYSSGTVHGGFGPAVRDLLGDADRTMGDYGHADGQLGNLPDTGFEAALAVASPAFPDGGMGDKRFGGGLKDKSIIEASKIGGGGLTYYGTEPGQLAQMPEGDLALALGSPPFIGSIHEGGHGIDAEKLAGNKTGPNSQALIMDGYGRAPGQLAALPEGDHAEACERPQCCIASPPWQGGTQSVSNMPVTGKLALERGGTAGGKSAHPVAEGYGREQGQLAQMPTGDHAAALDSPCRFCNGTEVETMDSVDVDGNHSTYEIKCRHCAAALGPPVRAQAGAGAETPACADRGRTQACISSPPWENMAVAAGDQARDKGFSRYDPSTRSAPNRDGLYSVQYGDAEGQLGQQRGSTFWAASRQILEEVYKVLAPGGHAIWVVKMFVRNKKLVDFPGQWEALCQSVGFKTVCKHRAWMNKNAGIVQIDFDGDEVSMELWYKSFFRLICERKGSPRIDWELVLCMVKE